jgi:hypothetical protein
LGDFFAPVSRGFPLRQSAAKGKHRIRQFLRGVQIGQMSCPWDDAYFSLA